MVWTLSISVDLLFSCREAVWRFFTTVCNNNLHVGMCMTPSTDTLRGLCRSFPGLLNNMSIDWFFPWPQQALSAVASVFLAEVMRTLALELAF
jgi:dynein heavy chain